MKKRFQVGEKIDMVRGKHKKLYVPVKQRVEIIHTDGNGNIKSEDTHNDVLDNGFDLILDLLVTGSASGGIALPLGMTLGTSGTAVVPTQTGCQTTIVGSFDTFEGGYPNDDEPNNAVQWRVLWIAGEATNSNIQEVCLEVSEDSTQGISRVVFAPINKQADDTLQITIDWSFS
jgi:hypothetical protein